MTIPAGRPIREAIDSMLEGFCEYHFGKKFEELEESDRIEVMDKLQRELATRSYRLTLKRTRQYAGGKR